MIDIAEVDMTMQKFSNFTGSDLAGNSHVASIEISHLLPDLDLGEFRKSLEAFNTQKLPYEAVYERASVISYLSRLKLMAKPNCLSEFIKIHHLLSFSTGNGTKIKVISETSLSKTSN